MLLAMGPEVGIYKRKQERKKKSTHETTLSIKKKNIQEKNGKKKVEKKERKHAPHHESDQEKRKDWRKTISVKKIRSRSCKKERLDLKFVNYMIPAATSAKWLAF